MIVDDDENDIKKEEIIINKKKKIGDKHNLEPRLSFTIDNNLVNNNNLKFLVSANDMIRTVKENNNNDNNLRNSTEININNRDGEKKGTRRGLIKVRSELNKSAEDYFNMSLSEMNNNNSNNMNNNIIEVESFESKCKYHYYLSLSSYCCMFLCCFHVRIFLFLYSKFIVLFKMSDFFN
jgi:hypothetical protein